MPKSTVEEGTLYSLPERTLFPAVLESVEEKSFPYVIRNGPRKGENDVFRKWEWIFKIVEGEYAGLTGRGDTEAQATDKPGDKPREWFEALIQAPVGLGEGVDTDLAIGLPCVFEVVHEEPRETKRGLFYPNPVKAVYPESTTHQEVYGEDPPY